MASSQHKVFKDAQISLAMSVSYRIDHICYRWIHFPTFLSCPALLKIYFQIGLKADKNKKKNIL